MEVSDGDARCTCGPIEARNESASLVASRGVFAVICGIHTTKLTAPVDDIGSKNDLR